MSTPLSAEEKAFLKDAAKFLENPGLFMRIANQLGAPIEFVQKQLPDKARGIITTASHLSLEKALKLAVKTISSEPTVHPFAMANDKVNFKQKLHTLGAAVTGGVGGFFGLISLPVELPLTTTIMLRSIAEAAKGYGFDLKSAATHLECLYVFTLGTPSKWDDAAETSYYASRLGLAHLITQAASFISAHSAREVLSAIERGSAPVLVRFIAKIASKFEIAVGEKVLSEAIPIIGAAGGAFINTAFANYFNEAARYHFGIRKLEQEHGEALVRQTYAHYSGTSTR